MHFLFIILFLSESMFDYCIISSCCKVELRPGHTEYISTRPCIVKLLSVYEAKIFIYFQFLLTLLFFSSEENPWGEKGRPNWGSEFWKASCAKCSKENYHSGGLLKGITSCLLLWNSFQSNKLILDPPLCARTRVLVHVGGWVWVRSCVCVHACVCF